MADRWRLRETVERTGRAVRTALGRRDARGVFVGVAIGYLLAYLVAIGHLGPGRGEFDLFVVSDPLSRMLQTRGAFQFEPVARLALGAFVLLVAPMSLAVGGFLAALVGANLALSYLAVREPAACGMTPASGAFAALPGLLSGAACCGPTVLVVLGIQASGLALSAFNVLVPISVLLLVGSLLLVGRRVVPSPEASGPG